MTVMTALRTEARWLAMHRSMRTFNQLRARRGHPGARLMVDPTAHLDPYPMHEEIRAMGRLVDGGLVHLSADHALVQAVLRDAQSFGVALGDSEGMPRVMRWMFETPDPELASVVDAPSLLAVDPPEHTRYRRLVTRPFTPRALQAVADRVEERAVELLDGLQSRRVVDVVGEYANLLPVAVIAEILGVPAHMHEQFLAWGHEAAPVLDMGISHRQYRAINRALRAMNAWFDEHFANLRRHPGDDILSQLVNANPDDRLTDLELRATALLLLGAGFETTVNLLGSGVVVIGRDEKVRERLAQEPQLWPQAVEELLRLESPVQFTGRVARRDVEVEGVAIRNGTPVICMLGAANRDPGVFDDPATYDLDRPNSREHVAFSGGAHYCLGAALAKMEGVTGLRMLFERFPDLEVLGGVRRPLQVLRGYESLLVDTHR